MQCKLSRLCIRLCLHETRSSSCTYDSGDCSVSINSTYSRSPSRTWIFITNHYGVYGLIKRWSLPPPSPLHPCSESIKTQLLPITTMSYVKEYSRSQPQHTLFISVIIKQWRLPPPSPLHLWYTTFRTLGINFIIQKYLFRLSSLIPSSRWYKGLNFNSLYTQQGCPT